MRIAIDAHSVGAKLAGNESYAINLIEALAQIDNVNDYTLYVTTAEAQKRFHQRRPNFKVQTTLPHTRNDVSATYKIDPARVTAISVPTPAHFGPADDKELQRVRHTYGIVGDYVLCVGSIQPRKNPVRLINAYASLRGVHWGNSFPKLARKSHHSAAAN